MRKLVVGLVSTALLGCGAVVGVASAATSTKVKTVAVASSALHPGVRLNAPPQTVKVLHWQWLRCNKHGHACVKIHGATRRTYMVRNADVGRTLRVRVVLQGNTTATSQPTDVVGRPLPQNTAIPTLSDNCASGAAGCLADPTTVNSIVTVGDVLTGTNGTWKHAVRFTYQWEDCAGSTCTAIPGATLQSYTIQDSDVGDTIVFVVTAYNF